MATRMLEIFRLTIKNENGLFFATYSKKAVKSPLFWMILVYSSEFFLIFFQRANQRYAGGVVNVADCSGYFKLR